MIDTPENATCWRELADQLTPDQIARLEDREQTGWTPRSLRWQARHHVQAALGDVLLGHIEAPADATAVHEWETNSYADGRWSRAFIGTVRDVGGFSVEVRGEQLGEGSVCREIFVGDALLTVAEARARAAALIAAADEIETWTALTGPASCRVEEA